jgi:hypothetical protein
MAREFPEDLPAWLRKPTTRAEMVEWFGSNYEGPDDPSEYMREVGRDVYLCVRKGVELTASAVENPAERAALEDDCPSPRYTLDLGPHSEDCPQHFSSETWEEMLAHMDRIGLL